MWGYNSKPLHECMGHLNDRWLGVFLRIGSTFENDIKELDARKAYKYLGIEESFDIQHKN
jgi:hypothetical protein